ncbi:unnamed protein product [Caenorhabditis sp. 36 PRJEB53466]|nr:unnamed protein product [Caenorhabditis sp. 36 PRJEB53466]
MLARHGNAISLHKRDLCDLKKLKSAFHSILHDENYRLNAEKVAETLQNQPLKPKEMLMKHIEFVGKYCPFHHMTPYSLKMPAYQRYRAVHRYPYKSFTRRA